MRLPKIFSSTRSAAPLAAGLLGLSLFTGGAALAQTPAPPQKPLPTRYAPPLVDASGNPIVSPADKQSAVNPYPNGSGNAQGRGVGNADPYWGVLDGSYPWNQVPISRVPLFDAAVSTTANVPLFLDGWTFTAGLLGFDPNSLRSEQRDPRANDPRSGNRNGVALNQTAALTIDDQNVYGNNSAATTALWLTVTTPSTGTLGNYSRAASVPRPNTPALQYITTPTAAANGNGFRFPFNNPANGANALATRIPGAYGEQTRLRVSVGIPDLNGDDALAGTEVRVPDARYFVFYYIRSSTTGAILPKVKVFTVSQLGGGSVTLTNDDGAEAIFPFFSYNTQQAIGVVGTPVVLPPQPGLGIVFQGVIVDNSTTSSNTGAGTQYVLADTVNLTASTATISATPTIVGPHGGRKNSNYTAPVAGVQPQQPRSYVPLLGAPYNSQIINEPLVTGAGTTASTNESFSDINAATGLRDTVNTPGFVNNPRDPVYDPNNPIYDATLPFESWNPTTTFMGPEALIDPRRRVNPNNAAEIGLPLRSGTQSRPVIERNDPRNGLPIVDPGTGQIYRTPGNASDANNFNLYGGIFDAQNNPTNWTPYFSQMQVIVARTEFVPDPENGVPDDQKDGTLTIQVGAVYATDWQTGAPIWRFPDKTYLPGRARNPRIFTGIANDPNPANRQDVYQVPGIVVVDRNGNGSNIALDPAGALREANDVNIEDEEVFIGQQIGSSRAGSGLAVGQGSGALFASITYAPRVSVQGIVQLPTYARTSPPTLTAFNRTGRYLLTDPGQTVPAPAGRYYSSGPAALPNAQDGRGQYAPVLTGMLYIASNNGVIYAIDAFGNNDNFYSSYHPVLTNPTLLDNGVFGSYQPGTTNVLWTFSPVSGSQKRGESNAAYFTRLKNEVPATSGFAASAPVLAYRKDERDNTSATLTDHIDPFTDELRLFAGNQNGVLYALDASANGGIIIDPITNAALGVRNLPIRKGEQVGFVPDIDAISVANHRADLKWWFRTRSGAINYAPTVSLMKQNAGGAGTLITKGVYFSSQEGRIYCVDWDGPVSRQNHDTPVASLTGWDGSAAVAALLNDDYYFHNLVPATANARPDLTEGDVRPRWAWPNLYRQTQAGAARTVNTPPDFGIANGTRKSDIYDGTNGDAPITLTGGVRLGVPEALGPPTTLPVLMDYLWRDPLGTINAAPQLRSYVAVVMDDPITVGGAVTGSRVYLLDQVGDRANFLSGTQTNQTGNGPAAVRGQYADRWTPNAILGTGDLNGETPTGIAWTYRTQYDVFPNNGGLQDPLTNPTDLSGRNSPIVNPQVLSARPNATVPVGSGDAFNSTDANYPHYRDANYGRPERRTLPTLYVGGAGSLFGLDIDPETGIFMRWRASITDMARLVVLPVEPFLTGTGGTDDLYPKGQAIGDFAPAPVGSSKFNDPFFGRTALRDRRVLARMITLREGQGGVSAISISGGPLQNRNNITPLNGVVPNLPTVPTYPTNDAPILRPLLLTGDGGQVPPSSDPDIYGPNNDVRMFSLSTRTNQDINDGLTTTRGGLYSDVPLSPADTRLIQLETTQRVFNQSYQYPTLFAMTTNGLMHEVSSNIEGEDFSTVATLGISRATGWGFQGLGILELRFNTSGHAEQSLQSLLGGASGPASGFAIVTPAYFPALDPQFVNPTRAAALATVPPDNYPNYPYGAPNTLIPTPPIPVGVTVANNDDPRPDFHVRPLSPGAVGDPGPDATFGTPDDVSPQVLPDRHTGQTGFPLDLNGLFFDKRFAGNGTRTAPAAEVGVTVYNESVISAQAVVPPTPILNAGVYANAYPYPVPTVNPLATQYPPFLGQDPNGDFTVGLRLPSYSDIGTALDTVLAPVTRLFNNQQADGIRANRRSGNLVPLATELAGLRSTEPVYNLDPANNATRGDDINPAGQNITWVYVGGANGTLYGFTPTIPGQESGLVGGAPEFGGGINGGPLGDGGLTPGTSPPFQVDLVDENYYNSYGAAAKTGTFAAPDRGQSLAARGIKTFYEWGETAYILVSNIPAGRTPNPSNPLNSIPFNISPNTRTRVIIRSRNGGTTIYDGTVNTIRKAGNAISTYPVTEPDGSISNYGVALLAIKIANPTRSKPLTPGDLFGITAQIDPTGNDGEGALAGGILPSISGTIPGSGAGSDLQAANSPAAYFAIANPLAVQGYATQTAPSATTNNLMPIGVPRTNPGETTGGVGPFFANADPNATGVGSKSEITDSQSATILDPNQVGARYSQALVNGQDLLRRELTAIIPDTAAPNGLFRLNPRFGQVLQDRNGGDEPHFYFPVAAGLGYVDHGTTGSTTKGTLQNLRVANRSLLPSLPNIRIQAVDPLLWHAWPGAVPNTEGDLPAMNGNPALVHNNPRLTPVGMDLYGRINPLPWETGVNENEPYNPGSLANQSPDYPDILLGDQTKNAPRIFAGGADISNGSGALTANVLNGRNQSIAFAERLYGPNFTGALADNMAVSVSLPIPKYQPANLVAIHTLTSVYQIANQADDPANNQSLDIVGGAGVKGPVQLPRGYAARLLHESNTAGTAFDGPQAIAPWGYSTKMVAYVDTDAYPGSLYPPGQTSTTRTSGTTTAGTTTNGGVIKAFREFELWVGVPVAMNLQMAEKQVDLGAEGHGFAMQNGLLGYGAGGGAYATGFLPTPLYNAAAFPANGNITPAAPYSDYFKPFTVQNTGNVNLWNLRSSQKIERPTNAAQAGSGNPFTYFDLRSDGVDNRFGIAAIGADPTLPFMPQVVTSLDPAYDQLWDAYIAAQPAYRAQYNGANSDPYTKYYAGFQGHHTLHKALPGATSPSVLGIPDVPTAQSIYEIDPANAGAAIPPAPPVDKSVVGVAVPLGTPSGLYRSNLSNTPLVVFEDHDTSGVGYQAVPQITGNATIPTISPAGPLYGGRNNDYFANTGANGGAVPIQTRGGLSDGTLRARRINGATNRPEYQPYTEPTFDLRVTVKETGLTGQAADRSLAGNGIPPSIATGVLPGADLFPLIDLRNNLVRASSALTPAAYRSANGQIHLYFSRNAANGGAETQIGEPYNLFASHLNWNQNTGVFVANSVGVPLAGDATGNQGSWFTQPNLVTGVGVAGSSNVTPYVLQEQVYNAGFFTPGAATLFFSNSTPTQNGTPVTVPYFAPLDANGVLGAAQPYFVNASPSLQRYAPRAVYIPGAYSGTAAGTTFLFYYGGVPGRWSLYYSPRQSGSGGTPTDAPSDDTNGRAEISLTLPASIVSASDPTPIVRRITKTPGAAPVTTVDMYYTGVSRATQTPDVYMTRYEMRDSGKNGRLTPVTLPRVYGEKLVAPGREPVWQGRHISWARDLGRSSLPVVYLSDAASPTGRRAVTVRNNWQYDNASGLLFQTFLYNPAVPQSLTTIYVDASAGTVRFRGAGTPRNTDNVYVDYLPQTYRITSDGAANAGTFALIDQSVLPATAATTPVSAVIKRQNPMYADRQFIFYQKGAQPGKPATLYYTARRVGIDLKSLGLRNTQGTPDPDDDTIYNPIDADQTIGLDTPTAPNFNSTPQVTVTIGGTAVPYDVDVTNGRIYVAPLAPAGANDVNASYENLPVNVTVSLYKAGTDSYSSRTYQNVLLTYLDEKRDVAVPMTQAVNEAQPYAFLDNFLANPATPRPADPTLTPGRLWLFWSTPRGREGTVFGPGRLDYPSAYDVFWQTLAPQFDPLLYTVPR